MNARINRQGLGRTIPSAVRREVRRRCKFGCVVCRNGFYEYEHLVPFAEVAQHDPDHICCLCEACHSRVTRGQWSRDLVRARYTKIQQATTQDIGEPRGPLDFHTGAAALAVGDLVYAPLVQTVVRYYGDDLIQLTPGAPGQPGMISAVFTDDDGNAILELDENEWVGSLEAWDIDVEGPRITVRKRAGVVALQLRLEPPGRIVVERLDMRIGSHHILVSERGYAVGAHTADGRVMWMSPEIRVTKSMPMAAAIEITPGRQLRERVQYYDAIGKGISMATEEGFFILHSPAGVMLPEYDISVASWCSFDLYSVASGPRTLAEMRDAVFFQAPRDMRQFMATG